MKSSMYLPPGITVNKSTGTGNNVAIHSWNYGNGSSINSSVDGFTLIVEIMTKFDVPVTITPTVEDNATVLGGIWKGFLIKFGEIEHKISYGFTTYDKEQVSLKLAAMYPEKILSTEEMKRHIYKDALNEKDKK